MPTVSQGQEVGKVEKQPMTARGGQGRDKTKTERGQRQRGIRVERRQWWRGIQDQDEVKAWQKPSAK